MSSQTSDAKPRKSLILNAFVEMCSGHQSPGLWRHPEDESHRFNDVDHWVELAQLLESAKFHGIFIADVLGGYDVYKGPRNLDPAVISGAQWPVNEPLAVVPAMAAATKNIGFGVTVTTTYEQPYHLARRLSTVDHLTKGRLGWNHDDRYLLAEEYIKVTYKLWESSWRQDAVTLDRERGIYTDPAGVRQINHVGKYFNVPGPHLCQPSPQRTPVILQAGTSKAGKTFAAQHAEAIFVAGHSPAVVAKNVKEIRELAQSQYGRDPRSIKFLALLCPILGKTEEEAVEKFKYFRSLGSIDGALALFGGWTGIDLDTYGDDEELRHVESNAIRSAVEGWSKATPEVAKWTKATVGQHITVGGLGATPVGTAAQVADSMERWVEEADVDGFNLAYAIKPGSFKDIIDLLIPELRKRGLFWDDYAVPKGTYRENLYAQPGQSGPHADHPASKYRWNAGVDASDARIPDN
ncbi:Nitrilotriacetate monooxygenase component A/pristinamycin IIA synthase subunit A [Penicillium griseofulvum]|uniref:Nitrilotriacetate monooxygenase component A/pristinamycin IIA synthase subunit A n=1 Tax=Penicillium patulum TaxID=5078 RepID=A0A135LWD3_PENPA|nr:Nitrilotriacetate monooxygenase component A/pristinamycin IIA synthase subunit A [Penicillium griseofulvum]KXG53255.1 Nitrilotriacetate monooxygenase component A/pristinamycin IIA synthase subunit A [Penicillium griseofulvum]